MDGIDTGTSYEMYDFSTRRLTVLAEGQCTPVLPLYIYTLCFRTSKERCRIRSFAGECLRTITTIVSVTFYITKWIKSLRRYISPTRPILPRLSSLLPPVTPIPVHLPLPPYPLPAHLSHPPTSNITVLMVHHSHHVLVHPISCPS